MKSVVLVVVMMGFAAASAMSGADSGMVAEETRRHKKESYCPEPTLDDEFTCAACKTHLNAMLTDSTLTEILLTYCDTVPRVPDRSGRARARCFALANSAEVENMVTSELVDEMCTNGLRCVVSA
ncbi:uncharacterized protein LOC117307373 [Asterias rubens]|uniref:uncharacterized protein LOC117307373 n=1 Tax=Asterias rubens TaxID=7604 RepID=UPI001455ADD9|nr:uncharacterized protein LOC117307373 [Asterias rubens]